MFRLLLVALLVCGMPLSSLAGSLYRWIDQEGRLHYSDRHPGSLENLREFENLSYPDSKPQKPSPTVHELAPAGGEPTIVAPTPPSDEAVSPLSESDWFDEEPSSPGDEQQLEDEGATEEVGTAEQDEN